MLTTSYFYGDLALHRALQGDFPEAMTLFDGGAECGVFARVAASCVEARGKHKEEAAGLLVSAAPGNAVDFDGAAIMRRVVSSAYGLNRWPSLDSASRR